MRTLTYTYDGLQRLIGAAESPGSAYAYQYDVAGNRTQVAANGATTRPATSPGTGPAPTVMTPWDG